MKILGKLAAAWLFASLFFAQPLQAIDVSDKDIMDMDLGELAQLVVTDTKIAQGQESVTQRVEVVNSDEIDHLTTCSRNISDLLKYRSGLFVNPLSRNDANWGSFGGLGPKYNGYLLDGLPIDSFADAMSLDPWIFERVELYKGPASVMYSNYLSMDFAGNQTPLAGITNFILRNPGTEKLTRIQTGVGSFGTWNTKIYHQSGNSKFDYFAGGNYEKSDYTNYGTANSWLNILQDPDYWRGALYARARWLLNGENETISLFLHKSSNNGNAGRPNRDFDHTYDTMNLAYQNQLNKALNLQIKLGYRNYDRYWGEDNFPASLSLNHHNGVEQKIIPFDLSLNYKHAGESVLTVGIDSQTADYETYSDTAGVRKTETRATSRSRGIFLQEKLIRNKWVFRAGGRINYTSNTADVINGAAAVNNSEKTWQQKLWSIGTRYNSSAKLAFYGNIGTSFVIPSAKQIWGTIPAGSPANGQLPNPDITEENGMGSDFGCEWKPDPDLVIGVRALVNELDDAIIDNAVSQAPSQAQSVNAGSAKSQGWELMVTNRLNNDFHWFSNVTFISSKVKNPLDQDNDGTEIPFIPDHTANIGITARLADGLTFSPYLHMVGNYFDTTSKTNRQKFGPYHTINLKIEKLVTNRTNQTTNAFIELNNLANKRYEMPWQFRDPGFTVFAGIEARFF